MGLALSALLVLWDSLRAGVDAPGASAWRARFLGWAPLVVFLCWSALGPWLGGNGPSGSGLARVSDWLGLPIAAYAFTRISATQRRTLFVVSAVLLLVSCAAAGLQHFGLWPSQESVLKATHGHFSGYRVYERIPGSPYFMGGGLSFHRLKFAHVSGLAVLVLLGIGLHSAPSERGRLLAVVAIAVGCIVLFPFARAAVVALGVGAAVTVALQRSSPRQGLWVAVALLALLGVTLSLSPPLRARFEGSLGNEGNGDRKALWATGLRAVESHPLVGIGAGRFVPGHFADSATPRDVVEHPGRAHNQFLTIAAETGLVGLGLFLGLLGWVASRVRRGSTEAAVALGILTFFVLLSLLHDPLYHAVFSMAVTLCLGACLGQSAALPRTEQSPRA